MADADLSATLAAIRERFETVTEIPLETLPLKPEQAAAFAALVMDISSLVAAVEAVLKEHQPVNRGEGLEPICGTCNRGFWPCPTYLAITRSLLGEETGDGR